NLCVYYEKIKEGSLPIEEIEFLSSEELAKDYLFLKLRLKEGFDENEFKEKFNIEVEDFIRNFQWFVENGLLERKEKRIYLTKKGILLANEVFQDIL
ncbi:MAG: coproporphyrinogen III oxidase family protein, partial [Dictyoglomus sp.]